MKLLFDENLPPVLVVALADIFEGSAHVREGGLFGPPPKVIWIGLGNCSTKQIADLLRRRVHEIEAFGLAGEQAFLRLA